MAHPVPEPFTWDSSFEVFYEHLDAEHRGLFDAIAAMHDAPGDSGKLNHLIKVSNDHFKSEEVMMEKAKYKDYKPHKIAHDEFLAKLKGLSCPVKVETSDYCKNWLVQHIKSIDAKYEGKLH